MSQGWCLTVERTCRNGGGLRCKWCRGLVAEWTWPLDALTHSISEHTGVGAGWRQTLGMLVRLREADEPGLMPECEGTRRNGGASVTSGAGPSCWVDMAVWCVDTLDLWAHRSESGVKTNPGHTSPSAWGWRARSDACLLNGCVAMEVPSASSGAGA